MTKEWFKNWFDSPYYHLLYHQRNDVEAELFIDNLLAYLQPEPEASFLDIACGRGRHAIYLNKKGFSVTGVDLSESNILFAQEFQQENLHFFVHDMRRPSRVNLLILFSICLLVLATSIRLKITCLPCSSLIDLQNPIVFWCSIISIPPK